MVIAPIVILLLGLFPALFLPVLQLMLLAMLCELIWRARDITRADMRALLTWTNVSVWQFLFFFLVNAYIFDLLSGGWVHVRAVALESWSGTLFSSLVLMLWLQVQDPSKLRKALQDWLPLGLVMTFILATYFYVFSYPGERIQIFTPSSLIPPLWFLIFTLVSFCWFDHMKRAHKWIRVALFVMAGIMAAYGAARLVMAAWILSALLLAIYAIVISPQHMRVRKTFALGVCGVLAVGGVLLTDYTAGGLLTERYRNLLEVRLDATRWPTELPRLLIWPAAWSIIQDNWLFGIGQINERVTLTAQIEWERSLRAHQTYLSYLIAGGVPALISGLLYQAPILRLLQRVHMRSMFPAFIGLGVVVTLNAFTDSLFQSVVVVQGYMVASLIALRSAHG